MTDRESPSAEQAGRIDKLEEQTQELQRQVAGLLKREKRRKRGDKGSDLRGTLSSDVVKKTFGVLLLISLLPIFGPILFASFLPSSVASAFPFPPWDSLKLLPGGKAVWMPVWQVSMLFTFLVGAVAFIASRD